MEISHNVVPSMSSPNAVMHGPFFQYYSFQHEFLKKKEFNCNFLVKNVHKCACPWAVNSSGDHRRGEGAKTHQSEEQMLHVVPPF